LKNKKPKRKIKTNKKSFFQKNKGSMPENGEGRSICKLEQMHKKA